MTSDARMIGDAERRARLEAQFRAEAARSEYGRTVADVLKFLKRARTVQVAVRVGVDDHSTECTFLTFPKSSLARTALRYRNADEPMPCVFDPVEANLCIGSLRAIRHGASS